MSEGVTTVGSIIGRLQIDSSNWDAELDRAEAKARELGKANPTLRIDSNAAEAVAALDTIAVEADKIGAKSPTIRVDTDAASAVVGLGAVDAATRRVEAAQRGATEATLADAAATEVDTAAKAENTAAGAGQVGMIQALIAAAPLAVAGIAPIGAAAVGLGAAFGVMAGSGILAINGIKQAMEVGDTVGNTYSAGLASLKGNLDNLSGTAANGMLSAFNTVVGDINRDMPFLNQTVGTFAGLLGNVGGEALQGVLTGLEAMNPLLITGGAELSKFVGWLTSFTSTNGFTEFVTYAVDNLPPVMTLIENLVTTAGHILAAFAPLGPAVIGVLSGISGALNALPLPVLAGLVTTATSASVALKLVGSAAISAGITSVAEAIGLTGVMANLAVPVVGILLAAVSGLAMGFATAAASTGTASASVSTYASELQRTNGVIDDNIRKTAAKALVDDGTAAAAQQLGLNTHLLTDYVLGNSDAQKQLTDQINAAKSAYENSSVIVDENGNVTHLVTQKQQDAYDAAVKLEKGLNGQAGAFKGAADNQKLYGQMMDDTTGKTAAQAAAAQLLAGQYGATVAGYDAATTAQQSTAAQLAQTTLNMQFQNDAAGLLTNALTLLNGGSLSLAQANTGLGQATNGATGAFQKNGTAIDGNSIAALANQSAIQQQVQAAQQQAEATAKATGKTEDGTAAYGASKVALENALKAQGDLTPAVQAYIDKLYDVNNLKVKPTKLEIDAAAAMANLATFQAHLDNLRDRTITVTERTIQDPGGMGSSVGGRANGSLAGGFATGGLIPQYHATGGSVASYLASGGSPFAGGPRGTDTVPTWLTPGEFVVNRDATARNRPALEAMNSGGTLTSASAQPQQMTMVGTLVLDSGEVLGTFRGIARAEANSAITAADRDSARRRVGV